MVYYFIMSEENNKQPEGGLLHSDHWATFLRAEGRDVIDSGHFFAVKQTVPLFGEYLYSPRFAPNNEQEIKELLAIGKEYNVPWIRVDVATEKQLQQLEHVEHLQLHQAPHNMQPKENLIIDITVSEEELLVQMKSKTRYNVRLAKKKDVAIHYVTKSDEDFQQIFDLFFTMVEETAKRKGVHFHPKEHYQKMFDVLPEDAIALFAAEYGGGVFIAANIVTFYNGTATYLHGATADVHRNLMAPFALQWSAIKAAKQKGCKYYDLGGVFPDSEDAGKAGITRFKRGFTLKEEPITSQGSYDIILSPVKYKSYRLLQKLRR